MFGKTTLITLAVTALMLLVSSVLAAVPQLMNYQGKLTDANGDPIDGTVSIVFSIYPDSTGGTTLWTEIQPTVTVASGLFNVLLGSVNAIPDSVFDGSTRWLGIKVGGDPEMTSRSPIVSVGNAFHSARADTAKCALSATPDDDWDIDGNNIYHEQGSVGIGTTTPQGKLDINGPLAVAGNTGIANQVLMSQGSSVAPIWADAPAGGQIIYDAIVAPSGGDYTDIGSAIAAGKKKLFIKNGTYTLSSNISLPDNTLLQGEDWDNTIVTGGYLVTGGSNSVVRDIKFTNTGYPGGIQLTGVNNIFDHVKIQGTRDGIHIGNRGRITRCHLVCNIFPVTTADSCVIRDNYLDGVEYHVGQYCVVTGNTIRSTGATTQALLTGRGCAITENHVICSGTSSIGICAAAGSRVIGNYVEGFSEAIDLSAGDEGGIVQANVVMGSGIGVSCGTNPGHDLIVEGNRVYDAIGTGFSLNGAKILCHNNVVYSADGDGFYGWYTIWTTISGNYAQGCSGIGFNFSDRLQHSAFTGNVAYQNSGDGFHINADFSTFTGNVAYFNGGDGFKIDAWQSVINSNNAYNNTIYGFNWVGGSDCTVVGNLSKGNNNGN